MASVLGLIDIRQTFLFHKEGEILNTELAQQLKRLNTDYDVNFHLFSADSIHSFAENRYMGVPQFWENYGDIAGLNKEAILGNGIFDISQPGFSSLQGNRFDKQDCESYRTVCARYQTALADAFLLDDSDDNLVMASLSKVHPINVSMPDYLQQVQAFVSTHASPRLK